MRFLLFVARVVIVPDSVSGIWWLWNFRKSGDLNPATEGTGGSAEIGKEEEISYTRKEYGFANFDESFSTAMGDTQTTIDIWKRTGNQINTKISRLYSDEERGRQGTEAENEWTISDIGDIEQVGEVTYDLDWITETNESVIFIARDLNDARHHPRVIKYTNNCEPMKIV